MNVANLLVDHLGHLLAWAAKQWIPTLARAYIILKAVVSTIEQNEVTCD